MSHRGQTEPFKQVETLRKPVGGLCGAVRLVLLPYLQIEESYNEMLELGLLVLHDICVL